MGLVKIYNVAQAKILIAGEWSSEAFKFPDLTSGDAASIEFMLLEMNPSGSVFSPWSRIAVGGYSLRIGLFKTSDRTQLTFQDVWADDAAKNVKTGTLSLSTSDINTALAAVNSLAVTLEIEVTDGSGPWKSFRQDLTLYKALITPAAVVPPASEIAATQAYVQGLFSAKVDLTYTERVRKSPSGRRFKHWVDDNGVPHYDPI